MKQKKIKEKEKLTINKSEILFERLEFVLSNTIDELDMTYGEVNSAILKLMDDNRKCQK